MEKIIISAAVVYFLMSSSKKNVSEESLNTERWILAATATYGNLSSVQKNVIVAILEEFKKFVLDGKVLPDKRLIACILAQSWHESRLQPIEEIGGASKPYAPYFGRGITQITHNYNYVKWGNLLGINLIDNVNLALDVGISAKITVWALLGIDGQTYTGVSIQKYINENGADYYKARSALNGNASHSGRLEAAANTEKLINNFG